MLVNLFKIKNKNMFKFYTSIVKALLFFLVSGVLFAPSANAQQDNFSFKSKIFQETREIVVHLPKNYNPESKEGYPVFYMLDADQETDEIAAQPADDLPEVIVIAIHNVRRGMDFLPHHSSNKKDGKQVFGNGGKFLSFIKDELIPLVNTKFRTNGRQFFHGHSWAGQFVMYALSESPELFDGFFITSPSIGRYGDKTFENLKRVFNQQLDFPAFVYVSVGGNERPRLKTDYDRLTNLLKQHLPAQVKLTYEINEGAIHDNSGSISIPKAMKIYFSTIATAPEATTSEAKGSYRDIPELKKAFINTAPTDRKDGILVGKLGVNGGNEAMILKLAQEISDLKHGPFDSFLIAHKGKLVFESYYSRGRVNLPHFQASATKVYTSLALGRAIQLGYLTMSDLDKPLISFLKDLDPSKFVAGAEKITLHKALTMRSGIQISKEDREAFDKNPSQLKGQGQVQSYLEHTEPITEASQRFKYKDDPNLVMQVIDAVVPGSAKDFIKKELLDKMGITNYRWRSSVSGLPKPGSSVDMTSRDMIKWGTLANNKGKWNGEQLIPEAYIKKATHRIVRHSDDENFADHGDISNTGYGYFWWQADMKAGNKNYFSTAARGGGGQYIMLIEELDLMVVVTAYNRDNNTLQLTAERVLPAFIQNGMSTKIGKNNRQAKYPALETSYFGEKPPGLIPVEFAPEIVSPEGLFEGGNFSPDMKEFYFSRKNGKYKKRTFFVIRYENNRWGHESETAIKWPKFSEDGTMIYGGKEYRERTKSGWSEPKSQGEFLKDQAHGISLSSNGTYYFGFREKEGTEYGSIRYSRLINGKHENPVKMGTEINTGTWIAHPFIAPNESYLMWDVVREDGNGQADLYISFRHKDGSWGKAINMGPQINTAFQESSPKVTHDGKYLFFTRGEWKTKKDGSTYYVGKKYWVDAKIIETLRPKSSPYTIAYNSIVTGNVEIYLGDTEGKSAIKSTNAKGGYLAWSPDGKQFAFYAKYDDKKTWSIHTMNINGTHRQRLTHAKNKWDNSPTWSPDGTKIAFSREYKDSEKNWQQEIWIMNSDGSELTQIKSLKGGGPYFTPDGRIVYHSEFKDKKSEISIADIDGNNIVQLTHNVAEEWHPEVSPDGKQIAFMSDRDGNFEIYVMHIDGSNQKRLTNNDVDDWYPSWSPDGSKIIFSSVEDYKKRKKDIYSMNTDGSSVKKIISNSGSAVFQR